MRIQKSSYEPKVIKGSSDFTEGQLVLHIGPLSKWRGEENVTDRKPASAVCSNQEGSLQKCGVEGAGKSSSTWGQTTSQVRHWVSGDWFCS